MYICIYIHIHAYIYMHTINIFHTDYNDALSIHLYINKFHIDYSDVLSIFNAYIHYLVLINLAHEPFVISTPLGFYRFLHWCINIEQIYCFYINSNS